MTIDPNCFKVELTIESMNDYWAECFKNHAGSQKKLAHFFTDYWICDKFNSQFNSHSIVTRFSKQAQVGTNPTTRRISHPWLDPA